VARRTLAAAAKDYSHVVVQNQEDVGNFKKKDMMSKASSKRNSLTVEEETKLLDKHLV